MNTAITRPGIFFPRLAHQERFREHVIATWRESGGEPDGAVALATLLPANGFTIRSARPHMFCVRPEDYTWQWPATFIEIYLPGLIEMGRIDHEFADRVRNDLAKAEKNPNALMITPLVLEIVAEKTLGHNLGAVINGLFPADRGVLHQPLAP